VRAGEEGGRRRGEERRGGNQCDSKMEDGALAGVSLKDFGDEN